VHLYIIYLIDRLRHPDFSDPVKNCGEIAAK